jgi:hypothetical protein
MKRRQEISILPDFPDVSFELGYRKKACDKLGIKGVHLYSGTRHSSVRALRKYRSPEEIKRAAMSETNKAFERYMGKDTDDDLRSVYRQSAEVIAIDTPADTDTALILPKST